MTVQSSDTHPSNGTPEHIYLIFIAFSMLARQRETSPCRARRKEEPGISQVAQARAHMGMAEELSRT
jgi:hypothetical protein